MMPFTIGYSTLESVWLWTTLVLIQGLSVGSAIIEQVLSISNNPQDLPSIVIFKLVSSESF